MAVAMPLASMISSDWLAVHAVIWLADTPSWWKEMPVGLLLHVLRRQEVMVHVDARPRPTCFDVFGAWARRGRRHERGCRYATAPHLRGTGAVRCGSRSGACSSRILSHALSHCRDSPPIDAAGVCDGRSTARAGCEDRVLSGYRQREDSPVDRSGRSGESGAEHCSTSGRPCNPSTRFF